MAKAKWYTKAIYLLIALALALFAGMPLVPQAAASPAQATFYSRSSDGFVLRRGPDYSGVHGASTGLVISDLTWLNVCQWQELLIPPGFVLYRGALFFDTSSLPDDATVISGVLSLYGKDDNSFVDFEITVVDGSVLHEPLVATDYGALRNQTVSGGTFDTAGFSTSGYNDIPLNETGTGWISRTGITELGLRSSRDITPTKPTTTQECVSVWAYEKGEGYQPKLVVTYTTPVPVGGEVYPENEASVLAPWIALGVAIIAGATVFVRRRGAQS